jgi:DNA-binding transcriptional regulator GbsR (MarR family)
LGDRHAEDNLSAEDLNAEDAARGTKRDQDAVTRFVERFASVLVEAGMPRMPARVFAALLSTDSGSLTAAELAQMLRVSPAAVSGAVRYLTQVDLVSRERIPGSRRDHYRLYDGVFAEMISRRDQLLARWETVLREGAGAVGSATPAGRRMAETVDYFSFIREELPSVLKKWEEHKPSRGT